MVLIVVVLLALTAYSFSNQMVTELKATSAYGRQVQAAALAESGVEYAAALLGAEEGIDGTDVYHDPAMFGGILLVDGAYENERGRFSLVAPVEHDDSGRNIRFGLIDESGKINLNSLVKFGLDDQTTRDILMMIPNMTEDAADSMLDWVDEDDELRPFGAEASIYEALSPPYSARNGAIDTLDELLLVNGVTPELLYGEDANRNGLLDPNEDDGDLSPPFDNADGFLDPGWSAYLTTASRESNLRADGSEKINVNEPLLTELYDAIEAEMGEEIAQFITAYRLNGPSNSEPLPDGTIAMGGDSLTPQSTGDLDTDAAIAELAERLVSMAVSGEGGSVTRGGLDLSAGASTEIDSLYELIDAEVEAEIDGSRTTLISPWSSDISSLQEDLPILLETFTVTAGPYIEGRVNVNQARREVLLAIPNMPADVPDAIIASRPIGPDGQLRSSVSTLRETTGWLLVEGLVDLPTMRALDAFITARGDVYRVQSVGHFDKGGSTVRVEALIDATERPAKILFHRNLSRLGPGYRTDQLFQSVSGSGQ